jgi:hypothetical protein
MLFLYRNHGNYSAGSEPSEGFAVSHEGRSAAAAAVLDCVYMQSERGGLHVDNFTSSPHDVSAMHQESAPECTEPEATCRSCARRLHSLVTAHLNATNVPVAAKPGARFTNF